MNTTVAKHAASLAHEVSRLRSFVIGLAGKDDEGNYSPAFVKRVLRASIERPVHRFRNAQAFKALVRRRR